MVFVYDLKKSESNKAKHGIDFLEGQSLWEDSDALYDIPDTYRNGEQYWLIVGVTLERIWTGIYTRRERTTRIVSIRPARDYERVEYENLKN